MTRYKTPSTMIRNARYRGHRESEKYLSDHQEQVYDQRQAWEDIQKHTYNQKEEIRSWFHGDYEEDGEIVEITVEKTFKPSVGISSYAVIDTQLIRNVRNVVVKLDNAIVPSAKYKVLNGSIILDVTTAISNPNPTELSVTMKADVLKEPPYNRGIYLLVRRLQHIDERLAEAERRYNNYENAYK